MDKLILLTGSNGFIGSHLKSFLKENGFNVVCVSNSEIKSSSDTTISYDDLFNNTYHISSLFAIIHLAARVHVFKDPLKNADEFFNDNVILTEKIARFGIEKKIKCFIFASSVKVMGDSISGKMISEKDPPFPSDPYGKSKLDAEVLLKNLFESTGVHCSILRFPMVYGPSNKGNMLSLLKASFYKIPLPLAESLTKERSFLFVKNLIHAIGTILCSEGKPGTHTFFLTDNNDVTTSKLYSSIFNMMNKRNGVFSLPKVVLLMLLFISGKKGQAIYARLFQDYRFSCNKFMDFYSWKPLYEVEQGLKETVEWYLNYVRNN